MMSVLAAALVLVPVAWLGLVYRVDYEKWFAPTISRILGVILLIAYTAAAALYGVEWIDSKYVGLQWISGEWRAFITFTVLPGVSLGIIIYPEAAAGYSQNYFNLLSTDQLSSFAIIGWVLFAVSVFWALAWHAS